MRLALVSTEWPSDLGPTGGMASHFQLLARALTERRWHVTAFVLESKGGEFREEGFSVLPITRGGSLEHPPYLRLAIGARQAVASVHLRTPFDLVVCPPNRGIGYELTKFPLAPTIVRLSSDGPTWRTLNKEEDVNLTTIEDQTILSARCVYCPSFKVQQLTHRRLGRLVEVVPSFAPQSLLNHSTLVGLRSPVTLGYFSGPEYSKGYDLFLHAVSLLRNWNIDFLTVTCLPRPTVPSFKPSLHSQVQIGLGRKDLLNRMLQSDIIVVPSRVDNCPNVALEAMSLGKIVVSIHGSGLEEIIDHGISGYCARDSSPQELASCILKAMTSQHPERIQIAARRVVRERFSETVILPKLVQLYEDAFSDHREQHAR